MGDRQNKHGLGRYIDAGVKLAVRQRCGFGCVVCGNAIVQYHHFDPPFEEATEHRAEGITLLCGRCHDQVTRGLWSDDKVRRANERPKAHDMQPHHLLDLAPPVNLVFGTMMFRGGSVPWITIGSDCLLAVRFDGSGSALLSARFHDANGDPTVIVEDNELQYADGAWDVEVIGTHLKVRSGPGEVVFDGVLHPPHGIYVRSFAISRLGWTISTDDRGSVQIAYGSPPGHPRTGFTLSSTAIISSADCVCIFGGPLQLHSDGRLEQTGGFMSGPFPATRFRTMALDGSLERLAWEIAEQPIMYVSEVRDPRNAARSVEAIDIGNGLLRYATFCDVCNQTPIGTRDLPAEALPPTSGMICAACIALPADGWRVATHLGVQISRHENRADAVHAARSLLASHRDTRVVVIGRTDEPLEFYFPE